MKALATILALVVTAQAVQAQPLLPWRRQVEQRMEFLQEMVRNGQQQQPAPAPIIVNPPQQRLPIDGGPQQRLPIPGDPQQKLPVPGDPQQKLDPKGEPKQKLNPKGDPQQKLPSLRTPQRYSNRYRTVHAIWPVPTPRPAESLWRRP